MVYSKNLSLQYIFGSLMPHIIQWLWPPVLHPRKLGGPHGSRFQTRNSCMQGISLKPCGISLSLTIEHLKWTVTTVTETWILFLLKLNLNSHLWLLTPILHYEYQLQSTSLFHLRTLRELGINLYEISVKYLPLVSIRYKAFCPRIIFYCISWYGSQWYQLLDPWKSFLIAYQLPFQVKCLVETQIPFCSV